MPAKKKSKPRNPYAIPAKSRKAGTHKPRDKKRKKSKQSQITEIEKEY